MIPIVSIVAYSGTGKTTFMEKLIPEIKKRGYRLAVVKHDAHKFEIDKEGKDSYRITKAGADVTGLISKDKAVIMENRPRDAKLLIESITDVDLILTEGFKTGEWPKVMLHRQATGKDLPRDPKDCIAVVSDVPIEGAKVQFGLEDSADVADFIIDYIKNVQNSKDKNLLKDLNFLRGVKEETLEKMWNLGRVEDYNKHNVLFQSRKINDSIYISLSGKCFIYSLSPDGNRKIIFIFGNGVLLNDHIMDSQAPSLYCETMEKCKVFVIPKSKFLNLLEMDFTLVQAVLGIQEWKMRRMGHQLKNTSGRIFMERRLAAKLWKLSRDFGLETQNGIEIDLNLSITFLSDMMGAPRETTSRLCKTLIDNGLIQINKKRITILNPEKMCILYKEGRIS